ncbi:MAG: phage tail protein I [Blastocatellales bacterium]
MDDLSQPYDRAIETSEISFPVRTYLDYLPAIFQNDEFLRKFLHIFETLWEPLELRQDHIEMYFDPHTCPKNFLPWLAGWLDLTYNENWPEWQMRKMLREGFALGRWRGTLYGLERIIELCTGYKPEISPSPTNQFVFHIKVKLSESAEVTEAFLDQVIRLHKPAHVGYILEVM